MSRYRDFPVLNDVNIQTHFQLEKHIVFHQMINHIDLKCERKNVKTIRWIVVIEMVRFERIFSKKKGVRTAISITTHNAA